MSSTDRRVTIHEPQTPAAEKMFDFQCPCGGYLVEKDGWEVCASCGGAVTDSGKYLPPNSGWDIPKLTREEVGREWGRIQEDEDRRIFWQDAF